MNSSFSEHFFDGPVSVDYVEVLLYLVSCTKFMILFAKREMQENCSDGLNDVLYDLKGLSNGELWRLVFLALFHLNPSALFEARLLFKQITIVVNHRFRHLNSDRQNMALFIQRLISVPDHILSLGNKSTVLSRYIIRSYEKDQGKSTIQRTTNIYFDRSPLMMIFSDFENMDKQAYRSFSPSEASNNLIEMELETCK